MRLVEGVYTVTPLLDLSHLELLLEQFRCSAPVSSQIFSGTMGRCPNHKNSKKKGYSHKTALRAKFMKKGDDLIHTELRLDEKKPLPLDEDLPGLGQYYCLHCDRYFASANIRDDHFKTKLHKKRMKLMKGAPPHCQVDADVAAGMGRPDNGPKLRDSCSAIPIAMESF